VSSSDGDQNNNHQAIENQDEEDNEEEEEDKNLDYDSIEEEPNNKDGVDSDHDAIYEAYNDNHHRIQQSITRKSSSSVDTDQNQLLTNNEQVMDMDEQLRNLREIMNQHKRNVVQYP
jgi:hypothetical protein